MAGVEIDYMLKSLTNIRPPDEVIENIEELRSFAKDYCTTIFELVPNSAERSLACRKLEESVMWAVKAMCLHSEGSEEQKIGASNAP